MQATGRGHSNSRGSLEPGKDKNEEVFLISLIFPILMTKQCVNEEVIKDIFVMTFMNFPTTPYIYPLFPMTDIFDGMSVFELLQP